MCDVHAKLVAWLDAELPGNEAADVARHVERCEECRGQVAAYKEVNEAFSAYCDAVVDAKTQRRVLRWAPALAIAAVAAGVLFLVFPRMPVAPPRVLAPRLAAAPATEPIRVPAQIARDAAARNTVHKRRVAAPPTQNEAVKWERAESAVQIAIPADAMFAPGAVPKGMNFIAELSIAPDGSVTQVRLRQ